MRQGRRRPVVAVIGNATLTEEDPRLQLAFKTGKKLVDNGFSVLTGGMGGVMDAAMRGGRASQEWSHGSCMAIIPGRDPDGARVSKHADIIIPTGLDHARNLLVAQADAVIAIGGGAGTLSEIAFAWMHKRLLVALRCEGWSGRLADTRIDDRERYQGIPDDRVYGAVSADQAVTLVSNLLPRYQRRHKGISE